MTKKYRNAILASLHETMEALHEIGAINRQTMREFNDACLTQARGVAPEKIKPNRDDKTD
jgi:putative transcriptional regulator